jgi:hypothetical protein
VGLATEPRDWQHARQTIYHWLHPQPKSGFDKT